MAAPHPDIYFWIGLVFGVVALGAYLAVHVAVALSFRDSRAWLWRIVSFLPLPLGARVLYVTARALQMESNLWPIVMIFYAPFEFAYLAMVVGLHVLTRPRHRDDGRP